MNNEREQVPAICVEVGLSCKRCTEDSATSLALVCKGLRTKAVKQLFHQIYPQSACTAMISHFAKSYRAASAESLGIFEKGELFAAKSPLEIAASRNTQTSGETKALGVRREVTPLGPPAMAAVA